MTWILAAITAATLLVIPARAPAQVFLATHPRPDFAIGPLFINASIQPDLGPVLVNVSWSLVTPAHQLAQDIKQDIYILWPAEIAHGTAPGPADPTLRRYVEARGYDVQSEGRLQLRHRDRTALGTGNFGQAADGAASYVTLLRRGSSVPNTPGSFIKIPWTAKMGDQLSVVTLGVPFKNLITPKLATWFEELFWGRRWVLTAGYGDVGALVFPLYPLYFEHRDRVIRLAPDYSLIIANFADAEHLRIAQIDPTSATRRGSRLRAGGEIVSLVLEPAEGVRPQMLRVHFSYFAGRIAWRPIMVSVLFVLLGNLAGIFIVSQHVHGFARDRFAFLRKDRPDAEQRGTVLPRETIDLIVPGRTTADDVVRLCGMPTEEHEHLGDSGRRTIVYRGTRTFAHHGLRLGRIATIVRRDVETHEVDIELDHGVVRDVQARVKRSRELTR